MTSVSGLVWDRYFTEAMSRILEAMAPKFTQPPKHEVVQEAALWADAMCRERNLRATSPCGPTLIVPHDPNA